MESRAPNPSLNLYKEVRLGLSSSPVPVIRIKLPSSSSFGIRSRSQYSILKLAPQYRDEHDFSQHHLSNSGALYFSSQHRFPRSVLWRLLEDSQVLELRALDLSKNEQETREAKFALQLKFPASLRDGTVALSDNEDPQILDVFALTSSNELYTCSIRRDFFCRAAASEEDLGRWCKIYKPATFSMSAPHRLIAGHSQQLIVSLIDGRLLQLTRDPRDDGARWNEATYGDGQWGSSLKSLIKWQGSNTVRFNGAVLDQNTPVATAMSPDRRHVYAVCLNHTLRVWNLSKASSVFCKDLLWQHREPHEMHRWMLNPANPNVLQIFGAASPINGDLYYAVTYSAHDFGQFKFWAIRDPDFPENGIRDLYPDSQFKTPDPDPNPEGNTIWKVSDFRITNQPHGEGLEMWILMRSSKSYELYKLRFHIDDLASQWQDCWCTMAHESLNDRSLPLISDQHPDNISAMWVDHLLDKVNYGDIVLETALAIYCAAENIALINPKASLQERMISAVASRCVARMNNHTAHHNHNVVRNDEWVTLYQTIQDLHASRWNVLSLSLDQTGGMPWIVFADGCAPVRCCSRTEIITGNNSSDLTTAMHLLERPSIETENGLEPRLPDELASLVFAAAEFRQGFGDQLRRSFRESLTTELWTDASYSIPLRIQAFYDACDFASQITSDQFQSLENHLEKVGGFNELDTDSLLTILESFSHDMLSVSSGLLYTSEGCRALIDGTREMIHLREDLLMDLLAFVVIIDMETDREETPMENFDGAHIYASILELLRQYQIMQWLVSHTRMQESSPASMGEYRKSAEGQPVVPVTLLECIFASALKPQPTSFQSESEGLTLGIQDLLKWVVGGNADPRNPVQFENVLVYIQCDLLKHKDLDLASDFHRFQPSTAISTYIKARSCLVQDQPNEAAVHFKQSAYILARPAEIDYAGVTSELLSPAEASCFGAGLPSYYSHVIDLFSAKLYPTQTAQFCHLALQLRAESQEQTIKFINSLFEASLQISDIDMAYSAMTRHASPEETLLPAFLRKLISDPSMLPKLLSLPFPARLHFHIDRYLIKHDETKTLAAWRLRHSDFQGAAAALLPDLKRLESQKTTSATAQESLDEAYLTIINLLSCAGPDEDWVLIGGGAFAKEKRKLVSLNDIRQQYQSELDRRSIIEGGKYGFGGG